jgi:cytochrome b561
MLEDVMRERDGFRFGRISIFNHWIVALLFLTVLGLGFYLDYVGSGRAVRGPWMEVHKAAGVVLLGFALWRITWRLAHGFPKDLAPMPAWQKASAKMAHWLLLFAIVAMPVSGILMSLYGERGINVFGLFTIPAQPENELVNRLSHITHEGLAYMVSGIILLHVGAVVKHHLIDKDDTLKRMLRTK